MSLPPIPAPIFGEIDSNIEYESIESEPGIQLEDRSPLNELWDHEGLDKESLEDDEGLDVPLSDIGLEPDACSMDQDPLQSQDASGGDDELSHAEPRSSVSSGSQGQLEDGARPGSVAWYRQRLDWPISPNSDMTLRQMATYKCEAALQHTQRDVHFDMELKVHKKFCFGPGNIYPPSKHICIRLMEKNNHEKYMYHVCGVCEAHVWTPIPREAWVDHEGDICPNNECGGLRFTRQNRRGNLEPVQVTKSRLSHCSCSDYNLALLSLGFAPRRCRSQKVGDCLMKVYVYHQICHMTCILKHHKQLVSFMFMIHLYSATKDH